MSEDTFTLELKKDFGSIKEIVEYLREMAKDIDNYQVSKYPDWQIYKPD
jgi:hypothetical protein